MVSCEDGYTYTGVQSDRSDLFSNCQRVPWSGKQPTSLDAKLGQLLREFALERGLVCAAYSLMSGYSAQAGSATGGQSYQADESCDDGAPLIRNFLHRRNGSAAAKRGHSLHQASSKAAGMGKTLGTAVHLSEIANHVANLPMYLEGPSHDTNGNHQHAVL